MLLLPLCFAGLGGCAQSPREITAASHRKEYFPSSVYGPASRRVIADGQPIPRGGGQYLVGKPYSVAGQTYVPSERKITQIGLASWYGDAFHGRLTANGEIYDRESFTAAHPTMPLPSYARVTNLSNHSSMIVRVNDRGPFHPNRIMDVSKRVAEALNFARSGTSTIKVEYIGRASLAGSDDAKLFATLRTEPSPGAVPSHTLVAARAPGPERVARIEEQDAGDGRGYQHRSAPPLQFEPSPSRAARGQLPERQRAERMPERNERSTRAIGERLSDRDARQFALHELRSPGGPASVSDRSRFPKTLKGTESDRREPSTAMPVRRPVHLAAAFLPEHHGEKAPAARTRHAQFE